AVEAKPRVGGRFGRRVVGLKATGAKGDGAWGAAALQHIRAIAYQTLLICKAEVLHPADGARIGRNCPLQPFDVKLKLHFVSTRENSVDHAFELVNPKNSRV